MDLSNNPNDDSVQQIVQKAQNTSAECNSQSCKDGLPKWLNSKAISEGQNFVRRNFFLIFFVHFISLILLLSYMPVRLVLLKTNRSHTKDLASKRYLSTLRHVKFWYEGDLTSPNGDAVRDVRKVCKIHSGVCKRLSSDIKSNPHVISQLDMIVTQYCFMGLLTTFPQKFGVESKEDVEGLEGFIHIWAVIGSLLGIEDQFNLCIGEKRKLKEAILKDILLKDLSTTGSDTVMLWNALVSAMSTFVPCLSIHASLLYILEHTLDIKMDFLVNDATLYETACYKLMVFLFTVCFISSFVKSIFNNLLRLAICVTSFKVGLLRVMINVA